MFNKEEIERYSRHLLLPEIGIAGQEKIKKSKVLVIGAGGLGCPALQYLTAIGIGEIGIVDFDKIEASNLQRQILYTVEDIGKLKAHVAVEKLSNQNPFVKLVPLPLRLDNKNALEIISQYDIILDGTDNFATRYLVNDACVILNKPLVYGSIHKFQGQVSVLNYTDNNKKTGPTYRCLFPEPPKSGSIQNCAEAGVLGVLPGVVGTLQAAETIKIITGIGEILSRKLLLFDALTMNFQIIEINRNDGWTKAAPKNKEEFLKMDYDFFCGNNVHKGSTKSISVNELKLKIQNKEDFCLLDVREFMEQPQIDELIDLQIPLSEVSEKTHLISKSKKVIVMCKGGTRSKRAIEILENDFGFNNLYNLEGGIMEWMKLQSEKVI